MLRALSGKLLALLASCALAGCGGTATTLVSGDGGGRNDGGCGPEPLLDCPGSCGGTAQPVCLNGSWQCEAPPEIPCVAPLPDAGRAIDAALPVDAAHPGDGGITCGAQECSAATEYCNIVGGGARPVDGGSNMSWTCLPLPTMPCEAGTGCACIPSTCECVDDGGITNSCLYP